MLNNEGRNPTITRNLATASSSTTNTVLSVPKIKNFHLAHAAIHKRSEREDHSSASPPADSAGVLPPTFSSEVKLTATTLEATSETTSARTDSLASFSRESAEETWTMASSETASARDTFQLPPSTKDISTAPSTTASARAVLQPSSSLKSYGDYVRAAWKSDFPRQAEQSSEFDFIVNILGGFVLTLIKNILKACTQGLFHFLEETCHYLYDRAVEKKSSLGTSIAGLGWSFFWGLRITARAAFSPLDSLEATMKYTGGKRVAAVVGSLLLTGAAWATVGLFAAPLVIAQKAIWFGIEVTRWMVAAAAPVVGAVVFALHRAARAVGNLISCCWKWLTVNNKNETVAPVLSGSAVKTSLQPKENQSLLTQPRASSVGGTPRRTPRSERGNSYGGSGSGFNSVPRDSDNFYLALLEAHSDRSAYSSPRPSGISTASADCSEGKLTTTVTHSSSQTATQPSMEGWINETPPTLSSPQDGEPFQTPSDAVNKQGLLCRIPEGDERTSATSTRSPSPEAQASESSQLNAIVRPVVRPSPMLPQFHADVTTPVPLSTSRPSRHKGIIYNPNAPDNELDECCAAIRQQHRRNASMPANYRFLSIADERITAARESPSSPIKILISGPE